MGKYFADIHEGPGSQLGTAAPQLTDSPAVKALRDGEGLEARMKLAAALNFELRYKEALKVYDELAKAYPDEMQVFRQRAPRLINTLQPRRSIEDWRRSIELGADAADADYRCGIACYLAGEYHAAMAAEERCFPAFTDEMKIAAMYWHTLAAWRAKEEPVLLKQYHTDMQVGHHTAYNAVMGHAAGLLPEDSWKETLKTEEDLEYSMLAYGESCRLEMLGQEEEAEKLRKALLSRDSFWISYAFIAAWNDCFDNKNAGGR